MLYYVLEQSAVYWASVMGYMHPMVAILSQETTRFSSRVIHASRSIDAPIELLRCRQNTSARLCSKRRVVARALRAW